MGASCGATRLKQQAKHIKYFKAKVHNKPNSKFKFNIHQNQRKKTIHKKKNSEGLGQFLILDLHTKEA
jgi:hypothetical protein